MAVTASVVFDEHVVLAAFSTEFAGVAETHVLKVPPDTLIVPVVAASISTYTLPDESNTP